MEVPTATGWIDGFPPHSGEMATLYGGLNKPGPYLVLMKWYPGYMSAPHTYATDRLSLVLSGTWWVNSGADFDPENTIPVPQANLSSASRGPRITMASGRTRASQPLLVFSELHPFGLSWWTRASRVGASFERCKAPHAWFVKFRRGPRRFVAHHFRSIPYEAGLLRVSHTRPAHRSVSAGRRERSDGRRAD
jgi:hypothetical protein